MPPAIIPQPEPTLFLKELFNPLNADLFPIYQRITGLATSSPNANFWRNELLNASRSDLFTKDGWNYTLNQLKLAASFTPQEIGTLNIYLLKYTLLPMDI